MPELPAAFADGFRFDPAYTLPQLLRGRAVSTPERIYVEEIGGVKLTYAGFDQLVRRWTTVLTQAGIGPGDIVASLLPPCAATVVNWMATAWCGGIELAVNTTYNATMLEFVLTDSRTSVLVLARETVPLVQDLLADLPDLRAVLLVDCPRDALNTPSGVTVFDEHSLRGAQPAADGDGPHHSHTAAIVYTSGTSGVSKGVLSAWPKFYLSAVPGQLEQLLGPDDAYYSVLPMFHVSGKQAVYMTAVTGARLLIRNGFSASSFLDDARRHGATLSCLTTATALYLQAQPERPDDADSPLRRLLVAPLIPDSHRFAQRFGVDLLTFYGQTEGALPLVSEWNPNNPRSVGRERPEVEIRIVDEYDEQVPDGQVGELIYRPNMPWTTMTAYLNRPEATLTAWRNGWFHTGDAMYRDADGDFFFVDRRADTIRRRGENISSMELERMICMHPDVVECAAIAVPSEWGEDEIAVFVVLAAGCAADPEELRESISQSLPSYMKLSHLIPTTTLPRTATGKVQKGALRTRAAQLIAAAGATLTA